MVFNQNQPHTYTDRPPRLQPSLPFGEIEVPAPPEKDNTKQSMLEMLLPLVMLLSYLLIAFNGQGRNVLFVVPMLFATGVSAGANVWRIIREREERKRMTQAYAERLNTLRQQMTKDHQQQRDFYYYVFPDLQVIQNIANEADFSRLGSRLWERRPADADFGALRLGVGTRNSTVVYKLNASSKNQEDPQAGDAERLVAESHTVINIPVTLRLYQHGENVEQVPGFDDPVYHSIGIYATSRAGRPQMYGFVRGLIAQFSSFHSYSDARLILIGSRDARRQNIDEWEWVRDLPHTSTGGDVRVVFEGETVRMKDTYVDRLQFVLKDLRTELQNRRQRLNEKDTTNLSIPFTLVIIDMLNVDSSSALYDIETEHAVSMILQQGKQLGFAVIFLVDSPRRNPSALTTVLNSSSGLTTDLSTPTMNMNFGQIPGDCEAVIEIEYIETESESSITDQPIIRMAQVGVNAVRVVGAMDKPITKPDAQELADKLRDKKIRLSAASTLVTSLDLLQLHESADIDTLKILQKWERSRSQLYADWPRVTIGKRRGNEQCELIFSADEAGVHGAIAGTTGSGKSELLLTLIAGLAINYDPSVINFLLVDFKGGAAFEELRGLPHIVSILTNLDESGVERMFDAIKAELDRRGEIIARRGMKHIVEYRKENYHQKQPFPHLFIIIDEFAEVVAANPEFKNQLNSITRLGRAIGVSLILAAQRPAGMITDQMRANMGFRICLRVEGTGDSREMIGISDAAYLPPGIPGRGYLQIGNDVPELIQVARTGGPYRQRGTTGDADSGVIFDEDPPVIWEGRTKDKIVGNSKDTLARAIVRYIETQKLRINASSVQTERIADQKSPFPDALPEYLALSSPIATTYLSKRDAKYMSNGSGAAVVRMNPKIGTWHDIVNSLPRYRAIRENMARLRHVRPAQSQVFNYTRLVLSRIPAKRTRQISDYVRRRWIKQSDWNARRDWHSPHTLSVVVGLIDQPRRARQLPLVVDMRQGHVAIFGAPGWGKTTLLRSLIISLATTHSPNDIQFYLVDFGGKNLLMFEPLPHVGAVISRDDRESGERFGRLLRLLSDIMIMRRNTLATAKVDDIYAYNLLQDVNRLPGIVVVIDGFAEVNEKYDPLRAVIVSLLRDGRNVGINFVLTADLPNVLTNTVLNLVAQRIALQLADPRIYTDILGRGGPVVGEIYGRGLVRVERSISRTPLEVQIASPIALRPDEIVRMHVQTANQDDDDSQHNKVEQPMDVEKTLEKLSQRMSKRMGDLIAATAAGWASIATELPLKIDILPQHVNVNDSGMEIEKSKVASAKDLAGIFAVIGLEDRTLTALPISLESRPHFIVTGPPLSGRTMLMHTWIMSLASRYSPHQVAFVLVDTLGLFHQYDGEYTLADLPHTLMIVRDPEDLHILIHSLEYEYTGERGEEEPLPPQLFVFIDNYDRLPDITNNGEELVKLGTLANKHYTYRGGKALHFILCGSTDINRMGDDLRKQAWLNTVGIAMQTERAVENTLGGKLPPAMKSIENPPGRAFLVINGRTATFQAATLQPHSKIGDPEPHILYSNAMDKAVKSAQQKWSSTKFRWRLHTHPPTKPLYNRSSQERTPAVEEAEAEAKRTTEYQELNRTNPLVSYLNGAALVKISQFDRLGVNEYAILPRVSLVTSSIVNAEITYAEESDVDKFDQYIRDGRIGLPTHISTHLRAKIDEVLASELNQFETPPQEDLEAQLKAIQEESRLKKEAEALQEQEKSKNIERANDDNQTL